MLYDTVISQMEVVYLEKELQDLVKKIQLRKCEGQRIEVKKAFRDSPTSLYDTLSSFSNQSVGGIIVFGLDEDEGFVVKGVYDAQDLIVNCRVRAKSWRLFRG